MLEQPRGRAVGGQLPGHQQHLPLRPAHDLVHQCPNRGRSVDELDRKPGVGHPVDPVLEVLDENRQGRLDLGEGYLLHGTPYKESLGMAATHGCVRLGDEDIEWLYDHVPVGTRVYIY